MSYYMGDYYRGGRGDYYRGDPFSLGGIVRGIGGALKTIGSVASVIPGVGTIVGGIAGGVGGVLQRAGGGGTMVLPPAPQLPLALPSSGMSLVAGGPGPVKKPGLKGAIERLLPGGATGYIRSRRMNVTNPRALRRAIRRVSGFGKLVQRSKRAIARANSAVGNRPARSRTRRAR